MIPTDYDLGTTMTKAVAGLESLGRVDRCPVRAVFMSALFAMKLSRGRIWTAFSLLASIGLLACRGITFHIGEKGDESDRFALYLRQSAITLFEGDTLRVGVHLEQGRRSFSDPPLTPAVWPADIPATWTSLDTTVAAIDGSGTLRAKGPGLAVIRVEAGGLQDTTVVRVLPAGPFTAPHFAVLALGGSNCGLGQQGSAYCWGTNWHGETGYGAARKYTLTVSPVRPKAPPPLRAITAGPRSNCALDDVGRAYCWGENHFGEVGDGTWGIPRTAPTLVKGSILFDQITMGIDHACGLTAAGEVYCWGDNTRWQLGTSVGDRRTEPTRVDTELRFVELGAGAGRTCGLMAEGMVYCWGSLTSAAPARLHTDLRFESLSIGRVHSCALTSDGEAYCWGNNAHGQLGAGRTDGVIPEPVRVLGGMRFIGISAGNAHTCAVAEDHSAWCWGDNQWGANGNGEVSAFQREPVRVAGGLSFRYVAASRWGDVSCGVTLAGETHCWGKALLGSGKHVWNVSEIRRTPQKVVPVF